MMNNFSDSKLFFKLTYVVDAVFDRPKTCLILGEALDETQELFNALQACRAALYRKLVGQHDAEFANKYPEIIAADAALAKARGEA